MKRLLLALILISLLVPLVLAESSSIGSVKQNQCINLRQTCTNCTWVNLTSVSLGNNPNYLLIGEYGMTKQGIEYNYTFCSTNQISDDYSYCVHGNIDGADTPSCVSFSVTPSGFTDTLGFYFILLAIGGGLIILGFTAKDHWFVISAGISFMLIGLYSINYGIAGQRDMFITWGVGLFEIFLGGYLAIKAGFDVMENG